jgi:thymidine kinase
MVTEGDVIVVGDIDEVGHGGAPDKPAEVAYEVLCRQHHRRRMTAARARAVSMVSEPLPFSG